VTGGGSVRVSLGLWPRVSSLTRGAFTLQSALNVPGSALPASGVALADEPVLGPPAYSVCDSVEANFRNQGGWYLATVTGVRVNSAGGRVYDLSYFDGDVEKGVAVSGFSSLPCGLVGMLCNFYFKWGTDSPRFR
jgi:hypothetical protein